MSVQKCRFTTCYQCMACGAVNRTRLVHVHKGTASPCALCFPVKQYSFGIVGSEQNDTDSWQVSKTDSERECVCVCREEVPQAPRALQAARARVVAVQHGQQLQLRAGHAQPLPKVGAQTPAAGAPAVKRQAQTAAATATQSKTQHRYTAGCSRKIPEDL